MMVHDVYEFNIVHGHRNKPKGIHIFAELTIFRLCTAYQSLIKYTKQELAKKNLKILFRYN